MPNIYGYSQKSLLFYLEELSDPFMESINEKTIIEILKKYCLALSNNIVWRITRDAAFDSAINVDVDDGCRREEMIWRRITQFQNILRHNDYLYRYVYSYILDLNRFSYFIC